MSKHRKPSRLYLLRLMGLTLLALVTSACTMRALMGLNVNADGSGNLGITMAFDEELRTLMEENSDEPIDWSDPSALEGEDSPADMVDDFPENAVIEPYSEGDFEGFRVSVDFASLEELNEILDEGRTDGEEAFPFRVTEEEGRFELTTEGELFEGTAAPGDEMEMISQSMLEGLFDIQFRLQLPGEIVSTNADETTDDGVMVWEIDPADPDPVRPHAVSEVSESSLLPWIILGLAVAAAVAVGAVVLSRRGKDAAVVEPTPESEPSGI